MTTLVASHETSAVTCCTVRQPQWNPDTDGCIKVSFWACLSQGMKTETRALWELLFKDMSQFKDFRSYKANKGGNGPDFKHEESGAGLWWVAQAKQVLPLLHSCSKSCVPQTYVQMIINLSCLPIAAWFLMGQLAASAGFIEVFFYQVITVTLFECALFITLFRPSAIFQVKQSIIMTSLGRCRVA